MLCDEIATQFAPDHVRRDQDLPSHFGRRYETHCDHAEWEYADEEEQKKIEAVE